jgi:ABC-type lipoprotein release transport system permease subunit
MLLIIGVSIGILFCIVVQPMLEGLVQVFLSWLTLVNTHIAVKISQLNEKASINEPISTNAIGFQSFNETNYDDDDEDKLHHCGK